MKNRCLILVCLLSFLLLSGCGNTMRQELSTQFQRIVIDKADEQKVMQISRQVLINTYGSCKDGKKAGFIVSKPLKFNISKSKRVGSEICTIAILPYENHVELYLQVSNKVMENTTYRDYSSLSNSNQSDLSTPMERGESLPQFNEPVWRSIGRNTGKESQLLSLIRKELE